MGMSDHCPVYLKISVGKERKQTVWRLNSSLLTGQMKDDIEKDIGEYVEQNDNGEVSPSVLWDACKAVMRGKLIARAAYRKKRNQARLKTLLMDLEKLEKQHKNTVDDNIVVEIKTKRAEINDIMSQDIQKKMIYTKQRYYEAGSRAAKLLACRLKKQQTSRHVYKIKDPQTQSLVYRTEDIHKCFVDYYSGLYSQTWNNNESQIEKFLGDLNLPQITDEQNNILVAEISIEEINTAISKLKNNKSPGADGYISEWYKIYRKTVIPLLHKTFNWIMKGGAIPDSWREAIISVIAKEGKDETNCSNYNKCAQCRLFTAILARRIEKVLPDIISLDQTGFIKNRQTHDNIRRTLHIMQHIRDKKLEALIMGLIKQNDNIKGIVMSGAQQKIALFADDILIYIKS